MAKLRSLVSFLLPHVVLAVDPLVELNYTSYNGFTNGNGITQWLGIRYAAPPVADLRFAAPQDPPATSTTQDASQVGPWHLTSSATRVNLSNSTACIALVLAMMFQRLVTRSQKIVSSSTSTHQPMRQQTLVCPFSSSFKEEDSIQTRAPISTVLGWSTRLERTSSLSP